MNSLPWSWWMIRTSGITAWGLLSVVVALGLMFRSRFLPVPPARLLDAHKFVRVLALVFLSAHLGLLLFDPVVRFTPWEILVPGLAAWERWAMALGTVALWLIVVVSLVFAFRQKLGSWGTRAFKYSHWAAYAAWPLATAHFVMAGSDVPLLTPIVIAVTAAIGVLLLVRGWTSGVPRRGRKRSGASAARAARAESTEVTAQ